LRELELEEVLGEFDGLQQFALKLNHLTVSSHDAVIHRFILEVLLNPSLDNRHV
jgi:hypothetical protein